ncbi:MAG: hypothetical protein IKR18_08285 [Bacteroidaceae bacterium]|nr:hypothetical protein [Bacteroidaceae bacterium]
MIFAAPAAKTIRSRNKNGPSKNENGGTIFFFNLSIPQKQVFKNAVFNGLQTPAQRLATTGATGTAALFNAQRRSPLWAAMFFA